MKIIYRPHHQIDHRYWDLFIENAYNGTFYAYSWFLNSIFEDWSLLVDDKFSTALVLTESRKFGVHYIKHPPPARYLGLFSIEKVTPEIIGQFLEAIPSTYRFAQLYFNKYMKFLFPGWHHYLYPIYELDLIQNSDTLQSRYSNLVSQWLEKAEKEKWSVLRSQSPNDLVNLWRKEYRRPQKKVEEACRRILSRGLQAGCCEIYSVYSQFNTLVSCGVFFLFQKKATLLFYSQGKDAFNELPLSFLIHHFLMEHSGRDLTLSLEVLSANERSQSFYHFPIPRGLNTVEIFENLGFQKMRFPVIEKSRSFLLKPFLRSRMFS